MTDSRVHAYHILERFRQSNLQLKTIREAYYTENRIPFNKRARIHVLVLEVLRWKRRLDLWLNSVLHKPIQSLQPGLLTLLEIAAWELILDKKSKDYAVINSTVNIAKKQVGQHSSGLVNAVLRKLSAIDKNTRPDSTSNAVWLSFPDWLYDRWESEFAEDVNNLCNQMNLPNALTIRRNVNSISEEQMFDSFAKDGIKCQLIEGSDRFYHITRGGNLVRNHPMFKNGLLSFQDRGAGAVVELLDPQPNDIIVDVCAAPGTKALYCAERMNDTGRIFAFDVDKERVILSKKDVHRHQMKSIIWDVKDAANDDFPLADKLIVDAPCTGTGVIGRKPDIKWRRKPEEIEEMQHIQSEILGHVCKFVKKNGTLLYSTCSIEREENWNVVKAFLKLNVEFQLKEKLELYPHQAHTDGMFAVTMERIA